MTREQKRRAFILFLAVLVLGVLARQVLRRGGVAGGRSEGRAAAAKVAARFSFVAPELERGERSELLRFARAQLSAAAGVEASETAAAPAAGAPVGEAEGRRIVFLSLGRGERPALVARGEGPNLQRAIAAAAAELARRATAEDVAEGRLKLDLAMELGDLETFDGKGRARLEAGVDGLWLTDPELLLLPEEILARRLVEDDGDLQSGRLRRYLAEGNRPSMELADNPGRAGMEYLRVRFDSLAEGDGGIPVQLYRGNVLSPELAPAALLEAARQGGEYLLRHQHDDGAFDYRYHVQRDDLGSGYNLLRHAGSCYSLVELYEATGDDRYLAAARRGIEWLLGQARSPLPADAGAGFEAIVSPGEEAKLGGAALAILAIVRYQQASGDAAWLDRARLFARFLVFQQDEDGHFRSKYFYGPPDPEPFESIYYPGEAILALARLHAVDPRPEWLTTARRGADWLIQVRDAGKDVGDLPHDHWLLIGLDELHRLGGEARYLEQARRIAEAILRAQRTATSPPDWVGTFYQPPRSTPTATRAEALVAMHQLASRNGIATEPYLQALLRMAAFQRRCQLDPISALYAPRPDVALGGFRRSLTDWEVRIDYVQHNLSALLGLRAILLAETP